MRELDKLHSLRQRADQILLNGKISTEIRHDLEKLAESLHYSFDQFNHVAQTGLELHQINDPTLRHDLRNVIGISQGYAELIREGDSYRSVRVSNLLDKIILWSAKSLSQLEQSTKKRRPQLKQTNTLSSTTINFTDQDIASDATVLIVDDESANRDILSRHVQQLGLSTATAANAEEAFAYLEDEEADLILLDLMMPGISGHEVLIKLKFSTLWRAIPVIVISGMGNQNDVIKCIESGADDYLQKPFNRTLLHARLRAGLERKQWVDKERKLTAELEKSQRFIKNTFGRYLSNEIVSNLLDHPDGLNMGGELQTVTILMADIRSFTTISEKLPPRQVVTMLNIYLGAMADIIMSHQGTVDEFIGDAILAIFGAPVSSGQDAENAIRCAVAMQVKMQEVNQENEKLGLPSIDIGIGLNTGEVIAGNIGSKKRSKYGVVGHAVNLTSRIEDQTQGGEVLVSKDTLTEAKLNLDIGRKLELQPKGMSNTIDVFQVKNILPPKEQPEE